MQCSASDLLVISNSSLPFLPPLPLPLSSPMSISVTTGLEMVNSFETALLGTDLQDFTTAEN